jgi:hypothetical protein
MEFYNYKTTYIYNTKDKWGALQTKKISYSICIRGNKEEINPLNLREHIKLYKFYKEKEREIYKSVHT